VSIPGRKERTEAARDALETSRRASMRLGEQVGVKETRKLLEAAARDLRARLFALDARGLDATFTAAQLRSTLRQVEDVLGPLTKGMKGAMLDAAARSAEQAAAHTLRYMAEAERAFSGLAQPLALDEARMLSAASQGAQASVLRRILLGPEGHPGKRGVLERYGLETVKHFEEKLQVGLVAKKSWRDMRDDLTEESPFLQGAPKYWSQRIVRTEVLGASNRGGLESIKQADEQLGGMVKIMSAVFDERTGADSFSSHGQIRLPDEDFDTWYGPTPHPPDRPNDRGVVTPHRIVWPIPAYLKWKTDEQVLARWRAEGRKGAPPPRPDPMTTVPLARFGKG
jgi:hypothetical protein